MKIKIKLLSNGIFGSGKSIPGGEDISVLTDIYGFPYLMASTFKGVIREAAENMVDWENRDKAIIYRLFGKGGDKRENSGSLMFSDFTVPETIRAIILKSGMNKEEITDCFTSEYTFTSLTDGVAKKGSLRSCRYINKDMIFYGNIDCDKEDEKFIINCLKAVKYIGSMTTRGFGNVKISVAERRED